MNPRHAAGLVGWYLMLPPLSGNRPTNFGEPLSEWRINESFDAAKDCEEAADKLRQHFHAALSGSREGREEALQWDQAITCIATDDSRLKEKQKRISAALLPSPWPDSSLAQSPLARRSNTQEQPMRRPSFVVNAMLVNKAHASTIKLLFRDANRRTG